MSKISGTRKQKAKELLERVKHGPYFSYDAFGMPSSQKVVEADYRLWAETWLVDQLIELVPELRHLQGDS
jgi:hypothetical protein